MTCNVFSTWEWASGWWQTFGAGRRLAVYKIYAADGRLAAILPLYQWSARPLSIGRLLGHGPADQLGFICAPPDRALAAEFSRRALHDAGFDLALIELLAGDEGWHDLLGSRELAAESSPTVSLEGGWERVVSDRSANFRQQVRARERKLATSHSVRFRLACDRERLADDYALFVSLHRRRWGNGSAFLRWEQFLGDFASVAFDRGWLRLWFLDLDGVTAAAWLGFRFGDVESYYQAGRDPSYSDGSVGFVLLVHSIREAAADGMREYRFLRGGEAFKYRFADCDYGVETHALARGIRGRLAQPIVRAGLHSTTARSLLRLFGPSSRRM